MKQTLTVVVRNAESEYRQGYRLAGAGCIYLPIEGSLKSPIETRFLRDPWTIPGVGLVVSLSGRNGYVKLSQCLVMYFDVE